MGRFLYRSLYWRLWRIPAIQQPTQDIAYIRCELPVIIWEKPALSDFVRKNGIGISIASLNELDGILASLTPEQYATMKQNVAALSERLQNGYYIKKALSEIQFQEK